MSKHKLTEESLITAESFNEWDVIATVVTVHLPDGTSEEVEVRRTAPYEKPTETDGDAK